MKRDTLLRGLSLEFTSRALLAALGVCRSVILARALTPGGLGEVVTVLMVVSFLSLLGGAGGGKEFLIREGEANLRRTYSTVLLASTAMALVLALATWSAYGLIAAFFGDQSMGMYALAGSLLIFQVLNVIPQGVWESRLRFGLGRVPELVGQSCLVLALLGLHAAGRLTPWTTVTLHVVAVFLILGIGLAMTRRLVSLSFDWVLAGRFLQYAWPLFLSSILSYFVWQGDDLMVRFFGGKEQLGGYEVAFNLPRYLTQFWGMSATVVFPVLARVKHDRVKIQEVFGSVNFLFATATVPIAGLILLFNREIMELLFGRKWLDFAPLLFLFTIAFVVRSITGYHWTVLPRLSGRTRTLLFGNLLNLLVLFTAGPLLIRRYGAAGGAYTNILVVVLAVLPYRLKVIRAEIGALTFLRDLVWPLGNAVAPMMLSLAALHFLNWDWPLVSVVFVVGYLSLFRFFGSGNLRRSLATVVG